MVKLLGIEVGPIGLGLMGFTWRSNQTPDEQAFATMKRAIELGAYFFNGGEFYGSPEPTLNLDLIKRFFTKYPEYADKVVLSIKGGIDMEAFSPDSSPEGLRKSVSNILKHLDGKKKMDLFECARVDKRYPIEETIGHLTQMVNEGLIGGISLSEVGPETIRRAAKAGKIEAVEIEFSLYSLEARDLSVLHTCAELGITVVAYSPLGRGFLTGAIKTRDDIPENVRIFDRFSEENFAINLQLAEQVDNFAKSKGVTSSQFALGWIKKHEETIPGLSIIPIPGTTTVARVEENCSSVCQITDEEFAAIEEILQKFPVLGGRYTKHMEAHLWG
ncbi:NADP-dependent oxidoreductase domain-containing protein [Dipodascopsis uninucleata]